MLLSEGSYFIVGGAGFIGSHFVDRCSRPKIPTASPSTTTSPRAATGTSRALGDARLSVVRSDASDLKALTATMDGHDWVIHLASNPDIARSRTRSPTSIFTEARF